MEAIPQRGWKGSLNFSSNRPTGPIRSTSCDVRPFVVCHSCVVPFPCDSPMGAKEVPGDQSASHWPRPGVLPGFSRFFPRFSRGFPAVFPSFLGVFLGFPGVFPGFSRGFSWGFPGVFPGFSCGFPWVFPGFYFISIFFRKILLTLFEINHATSPKLYQSYFPHRSRDSLSLVCQMFLKVFCLRVFLGMLDLVPLRPWSAPLLIHKKVHFLAWHFTNLKMLLKI